jgi:hypothetical protein
MFSREEVLDMVNKRFREILAEHLEGIAYQTEPGKYNWNLAIELAEQCELGEPFPDDGIYGWLFEGEWYPNHGLTPGRAAYKHARDALIQELINDDTLPTDLYFIAGGDEESCGVCQMFEGRILDAHELQHAMSMGLFHFNCIHYAVPVLETDEILDMINRTRD